MRNYRYLGLVFTLLLAIVPAVGSAAEPASDILPFKATTKTLPNGLVVMVVPTGFPNIVSLQIPVQTGSRNEVEPGKSGFAHFFEHMMFRGTPTLSPDAYNAIITQAGARQNAYTTDDYTNYHITFAKEDLDTILRIEADRFQNLSYPVEAFKTESRAVLGEYNKNSANPIQKLYEVLRAKAFTTHTYRHTTMGFIEDIEDMPNQYEYSKTFFSRWYRPENTAVIIAGDVDPDQVIPLVEKYWGDWAPGSGEKIAIPQEPAPKGAAYAHVPWETATAPWVVVAFRGPAFSETGKESAAMDLLMSVNFGNSSDFYRRLVEQEQKVDQVFAASPNNADPELIYVFARVKNVDDVKYVRDEITAHVRDGPGHDDRCTEARGSKVQRPLLVHCKSRQYRQDRRHARDVRPAPPLVRHDQQLLPRLRIADAGGSRRGCEKVLHRRLAGGGDAVPRAAADGDGDIAAARELHADGRKARLEAVHGPEVGAAATHDQAAVRRRLGLRPQG